MKLSFENMLGEAVVKKFDDLSRDFTAGYLIFVVTSLPVLGSVLLGSSVNDRAVSDPVTACIRFDAGHQLEIVNKGYSYDHEKRSLVAFFPAYPLISRWVGNLLGVTPEEGLLVTANTFLIGAFLFLARWARIRWKGSTDDQRIIVLFIFGLWPMGFFFRMPYAESLHLFVAFAFLNGMARRWPTVALAALAGFLTGIRPVGVAATAAFVWYLSFELPSRRFLDRLTRILVWTPVACWGLIGYMVFQYVTFGNALAFAQTQSHWTLGVPQGDVDSEKVFSLATLEPIRNIYNPASSRYWRSFQPSQYMVFNVMFWNPIFFGLAAGLVALGAWKHWLTGAETVFGICLLLIPYLTRAYEMSMGSHGRFAAAVAPAFLVLGRVFAHFPAGARISFCIILTTFLVSFGVLYAGGKLFF